MPKPPSDRPKLERSVLAAKLLIIRKTTKLGFHQEPQFRQRALKSGTPIPLRCRMSGLLFTGLL